MVECDSTGTEARWGLLRTAALTEIPSCGQRLVTYENLIEGDIGKCKHNQEVPALDILSIKVGGCGSVVGHTRAG